MREFFRRVILFGPLLAVMCFAGVSAGCSEKSEEEKVMDEIQKEFEEATDE